MRPWARVALGCLVLAACGKKEGDAGGGSATAAEPSAGPATGDTAAVDPLKGLAVPEVAAAARAEQVTDGPVLVVKATEISFDGTAVAAVANGKIDPAELEGGSVDPRISKLEHYAAARAKVLADTSAKAGEARTPETVLVAIDPSLPSELALQVVRSFRKAEQERFGFLVRTPEGLGVLPITVPATAPPVVKAKDPDEVPLGVVVALVPDRVLVVSLSQLEGTLADPRLDLQPSKDTAWATRLRDTLAEIAKQRWYGRSRPEHQKTIYLIADGAVASGDVVAAIVAMRHDATGQPLFPDVQLLTAVEIDREGHAAAARAAAPPPPPPPPPPRDETAKAVAIDDEAYRFADMLIGEADHEPGDNDLQRRPGADLAAQIAKVREGDTQTAVGGDGLGGVVAATGESDAVKTPQGRIAVVDKAALEDSSLAVDEVLRKVFSAYMAGLKRCYKNELKKDPDLRGAIDLRLTVNESGRSVDARASGFDAEVDRCVQGQMANWRFPSPKDGDGDATVASFRIKLAFTPE